MYLKALGVFMFEPSIGSDFTGHGAVRVFAKLHLEGMAIGVKIILWEPSMWNTWRAGKPFATVWAIANEERRRYNANRCRRDPNACAD